jgi:hypothetical protein
LGIQPDVLEAYSRAIDRMVKSYPGNIRGYTLDVKQVHRRELSEDYFWGLTQLAAAMYKHVEPDRAMARQLQNAMGIDAQGRLYREVKRLIKELFIMIHIKIQQRSVTQTFAKQLQCLAQPSLGSKMQTNELRHVENIAASLQQSSVSEERRNAEFIFQTRYCVDSLLENFNGYVEELKAFKDIAETAALSVSIAQSIESTTCSLEPQQLKNLLNFKQQQSAVIEGRETAWQNFKQGRSMMIFTAVTVLFVSFLTCLATCGYALPVESA